MNGCANEVEIFHHKIIVISVCDFSVNSVMAADLISAIQKDTPRMSIVNVHRSDFSSGVSVLMKLLATMIWFKIIQRVN